MIKSLWAFETPSSSIWTSKFTHEGSYSLDFKGSIPLRRDIHMEAYQLAFKTLKHVLFQIED
jgi:hypothetical protein